MQTECRVCLCEVCSIVVEMDSVKLAGGKAKIAHASAELINLVIGHRYPDILVGDYRNDCSEQCNFAQRDGP